MASGLWFALICAVIAIVYGAISIKWIMAHTNNAQCRAAAQNLPLIRVPVKPRTRTFQVFRRVHPGVRRIVAHGDRDGKAVPERAQLFERLEPFQRRRCKPRKTRQKARPICVDADVPVTRQPGW